jgi:hypothetical protein
LRGEQIVLPASATTWLINQPNDVLSTQAAHADQLQPKFCWVQPIMALDPFHEETIKHELTRRLGSLTMDIMDKLGTSFDEIWGTNTVDWQEVCVFTTLMQIIARASNRVFVGLPLCRDEKLLHHEMGFAKAVAVSSFIIQQVTPLLRPLAAMVVCRPNRQHTKAFVKQLIPEVERRQRLIERNLEAKKGDQPGLETEPSDFLQWHLHRARTSSKPCEYDPAMSRNESSR